MPWDDYLSGHPLLWLGLMLLKTPFRFIEEYFRKPVFLERDLEFFLEDFFKQLSKLIPPSMIREYKLADGTVAKEVGPVIYGFSFKLDREGRPMITQFGNLTPSTIAKAITMPIAVLERRKPLFDLLDEGDKLRISIELPGARKESIKVSATPNSLTIDAEGKDRTYYGEVRLPVEVDPKNAKSTYTDGILEVILPKKEGLKPKGEPVKIE
jgi:HSP20 family protein